MRKNKPSAHKHGPSLHPDFEERYPFLRYFVWIPFVLAFILYGNTIGHEFALDDIPQIVNHKYVQQGWAGIKHLATQDYWAASGVYLGYYRPLSHITFAIENALHGNNPMIMHLVNVVLYGITGMVVYLFLNQLFRKMTFFVLLATIFFMAHPVHTEVVANVKSRDEILSFLNSTLSLLLVFNFVKNKNWFLLAGSIIFYFLALLSKETAMTTLALIPFMLYFFTPKEGSYIARITLLFVLVSALFLWLKWAMLGTLTGSPPVDINNYPYRDISLRIPTALYIFGFYLWRLIFPLRLIYDYSYNQIPETGWDNPLVWLALIILAGLIALALINLKRRNIISFAIIYFGITLSPGIAFIIFRGGIMAERFLYAPVLGFSIAMAYLLFKLLPREKNTGKVVYDFRPLHSKIFLFAIIFLSIFYSVRTIARNPVWKNNFTLFSNDIRYGGNSAQLRKHYGSELVNQAVASEDPQLRDSLMKAGISELMKSISINPRFGEAYFKLGYAYYQMRDFDTSIDFYKKANPSSMTIANMAMAYYMKGDYLEAMKLLKKALEMDPDNVTARTNMPLVSRAFNQKLQMMESRHSDDPDHYFELGNLYVEQQRYEEALINYQKAFELKPDYIGALVNVGNCYYMLQDYHKALETFHRALELNPNHKLVLRNLGHLYGLLGDIEKQQYYESRAR